MGCTFSITPVTKSRRKTSFVVEPGTQLICQFDATSVYINKPVDGTDVSILTCSGEIIGFRDNGLKTVYTMPDEVKEIRGVYVGDDLKPKNESYSFDEQQPEGEFYFVIDFNGGRFNNGVSPESFCDLHVYAVTDVFDYSGYDRHEINELLKERGFISGTAFSSTTNREVLDAFTLKSEGDSQSKTRHLKLIGKKDVVLRLYLSRYFPLYRGEDGSILNGKIPLFSNSNVYIKKYTGVMFKTVTRNAFIQAAVGKDKNGWYVVPPAIDEDDSKNNYVIDLSVLEFDFITPFSSDYDIQDFLARSYEQTVTTQIKTDGSDAGFCSLCDVATLLGGNDIIIINQDKDFISRDKMFIVKIIKQYINQTTVYCIESTALDNDNTSGANYDMLPPKGANIRAELRGDEEMLRIKMADGTTEELIHIEGHPYKPLRSYYFYYDGTYHDLLPDVSCNTLADLADNIGAVSISGDDGGEKDEGQNSWKKLFTHTSNPLQIAFEQEYSIKTKQRSAPQHTGYGFVIDSQEINGNLYYWTTITISYIDNDGYAHVCLDYITLINSASRSFHIKDIPLSNYGHKNTIFIENACGVYEEDGSLARSAHHTNTGYHFKDERIANDLKISLLGQSMQFKNYKANNKYLNVLGFNNNNNYAVYNKEKQEYNIDVSGYFLDESSSFTKQQSQMGSAVPQVFPIILEDFMSVPAEKFTIKCDIDENTIRVNGREYDIEENDLVCLYQRTAGALSGDFLPTDISDGTYGGYNPNPEGKPADFRSYIGNIAITKDRTKDVNTSTDVFVLKPGQYVITEEIDVQEKFPDNALYYYSQTDKTQDLLKHILLTKTLTKTLTTPYFNYTFTGDENESFRVGPNPMQVTCDFKYQILDPGNHRDGTGDCQDGTQTEESYTPSVIYNGFETSYGKRLYRGDSNCNFAAYIGGDAVVQRAELDIYNRFHVPAGLIGTDSYRLFSGALNRVYGKNFLNFITYKTVNSYSREMYVSNTTENMFWTYQLVMNVCFTNRSTNPYAYGVVLGKNMKEALDIDDNGLIYKTNTNNCCEIVGLCANPNGTIKIPSHHNGKPVVKMQSLLPDHVNELIIENQELIDNSKLSDFFTHSAEQSDEKESTSIKAPTKKINKLILRVTTIPKGFLDDDVSILTLIDENSVRTILSNQTANITNMSLGTEINEIANDAFSNLSTKSQIIIHAANKIGGNAFNSGIIFVHSEKQKPTTGDENGIGINCFVYGDFSDGCLVKEANNIVYCLNLDAHTATVVSFASDDYHVNIVIPQSIQSNGIEYTVTEIGGFFGKNHYNRIRDLYLPKTIKTINVGGLYSIDSFYVGDKLRCLIGDITTVKTDGIDVGHSSIRIGKNVEYIDQGGVDAQTIYVEHESKPDGGSEDWCYVFADVYGGQDLELS